MSTSDSIYGDSPPASEMQQAAVAPGGKPKGGGPLEVVKENGMPILIGCAALFFQTECGRLARVSCIGPRVRTRRVNVLLLVVVLARGGGPPAPPAAAAPVAASLEAAPPMTHFSHCSAFTSDNNFEVDDVRTRKLNSCPLLRHRK